MEKKFVYDAPMTEQIFVSIEENFLQTGIDPSGDVDPSGDGGDD